MKALCVSHSWVCRTMFALLSVAKRLDTTKSSTTAKEPYCTGPYLNFSSQLDESEEQGSGTLHSRASQRVKLS